MRLKLGAIELVELGRKRLPKPMRGGLIGWKKNMSDTKRRAKLEKLTRAEGCTPVLRKVNLLANLTADKATEKKLRSDYRWLRAKGFCKLKSKK